MRVEQGSGLGEIPLPIPCRQPTTARNSAAGRDAKISDKLLIYTRFMAFRGRPWRAKPDFSLPAGNAEGFSHVPIPRFPMKAAISWSRPDVDPRNNRANLSPSEQGRPRAV